MGLKMNTNSAPIGFENFSNQQILDFVAPRIDMTTNRIVGIYGEVSAGMIFGSAVEGVYFRGVDTLTGDTVEAFYAGATLGVTAIPAGVSGGVFGFTGSPKNLGGWSVGTSGTAFISTGISIPIPSNDFIHGWRKPRC
jgi:hypothetical protein